MIDHPSVAATLASLGIVTTLLCALLFILLYAVRALATSFAIFPHALFARWSAARDAFLHRDLPPLEEAPAQCGESEGSPLQPESGENADDDEDLLVFDAACGDIVSRAELKRRLPQRVNLPPLLRE